MSEEKRLPVSHPWVAVDFDGTLCEDGYWPEIGPPRQFAQKFCDELHAMGVKIMIFTARTAITDFNGKYMNVLHEIEKIQQWCLVNDIQVDYIFPGHKPTQVIAFFDDRAITVGRDTEVSALESALCEFSVKWRSQIEKDWKQAVLPRKEGE